MWVKGRELETYMGVWESKRKRGMDKRGGEKGFSERGEAHCRNIGAKRLYNLYIVSIN